MDQYTSFLENQVSVLEREKVAALEALSLAASLGNFSSEYAKLTDESTIMEETCRRAKLMVAFRNSAVYLIDENTQDIGRTFHSAQKYAVETDAEVDSLISDHSFVYAMQVEKPCFYRVAKGNGRLLLHVLTTSTRVRGMFVGWLEDNTGEVLDTALGLLPVIMMASAHALESCERNRRFKEYSQKLEREVADRTQQLQTAHDQLKNVLQSMATGMLMVDEESGTIVDANTAGLHMLETDLEGIVGHQSNEHVCPAEDGECGHVDAMGLAVEADENVLITSTGKRIPVIKTSAFAEINGRKYQIQNFVDVSEQKKLENLKEDIERISRHDLKAPLTGIIGIPDILADSLELTDHNREMLMYIKQSGYKMLRLINMSLDLYKMETGVYMYTPATVKFGSVLWSVLDELGSLFSAKVATAHVQVDGTSLERGQELMIESDELLQYSLLGNLIANAAEASPQGGIVSVDIRTGKIVEVRIHNMGTVPVEIRDTFFDKYVTSGKRHGTGLGSYSARLMVETMGGTISMQTDEEQGTTLLISLPQ